MDAHAFGAFLRTRRDALQPEDVGLHRGARRRATGLRRDEVAQLSAMSSDYLARLERGDGLQPSEQIVTALARGLRLTGDELDHLLVLAGHPTASRTATTHVGPGLLRVLDALETTPALVLGPVGDTLAENGTAVALFGADSRRSGLDRYAAYRWFTDPTARALYRSEGHEQHGRVIVAQLRGAAARLGPDSPATALTRRLRTSSPEFAELWDRAEVGLRFSEEKHLQHPEVGDLSLHCQTVLDPDHLQTLLILTATPGSTSAERLRLLAVIGGYRIATTAPAVNADRDP